MGVAVFSGLVLLSAVGDVLSLSWHRAREACNTRRLVFVGVGLDIVNAIPLMVAIELGAWWPIAAAIVGTVIGTLLGAKRATPGG